MKWHLVSFMEVKIYGSISLKFRKIARFYIILIPLMEVRYFGFEILPEVNVDIKNNQAFYNAGKIYFAYQVHVRHF